jgi:hypothetical protein
MWQAFAESRFISHMCWTFDHNANKFYWESKKEDAFESREGARLFLAYTTDWEQEWTPVRVKLFAALRYVVSTLLTYKDSTVYVVAQAGDNPALLEKEQGLFLKRFHYFLGKIHAMLKQPIATYCLDKKDAKTLLKNYRDMSWKKTCARRMDGTPMGSIIRFRGDVKPYLKFVTHALSLLLESCVLQHSMREREYAEAFAAARAFVREGTPSLQTDYIQKMRPLVRDILFERHRLGERMQMLACSTTELVEIMRPDSRVERVVQECFRKTEIELDVVIRRRAVMESTHRRLGEASPLRLLPNEILRDIHGRYLESPGPRDPWLKLRWPV